MGVGNLSSIVCQKIGGIFWALSLGFAREMVKGRFLISSISAGIVARELRDEWPCYSA